LLRIQATGSAIAPMTECRNLAQLADFVTDLA
jgi:hypothetical protein